MGSLPTTYTLVRENWLTQKPSSQSHVVVLLTTTFLLMMSFFYWNGVANFPEWAPASNLSVFQRHEYWRAWTTLFVHADLKHLISNAFLFYWLGYFLNGYFGGFVFPLLALVSGGLVNLIVLSGMPANVQLIGMSGVVFWMGAFWLLLYCLLETRKSRPQRLLRAFGVALVLFMPSEVFNPRISYLCHFFGFLLGLLFGLIYYLKSRDKFQKAVQLETIVED